MEIQAEKARRSQEKIGTKDKAGARKEERFDSLVIYG
jgi:hypothetical protein